MIAPCTCFVDVYKRRRGRFQSKVAWKIERPVNKKKKNHMNLGRIFRIRDLRVFLEAIDAPDRRSPGSNWTRKRRIVTV